MTNNNILPQGNFINNVAQNLNTVRLRINKGVMSGNIIDGNIDTAAEFIPCDNSLIFVCLENSQYIPLL